jgi:RND superfamily putative drug exporter
VRRLAIFVVHRRWAVLVLSVVALPLFALVGGGVHDRLSTGGFDDPGAPSTRADAIISRDFPEAASADFVVVVTATAGDVDDPVAQAAARALAKHLEESEGVRSVTSYWALGIPGDANPLRSADGNRALIVAALEGDADAQLKYAEELSPEMSKTEGPITSLVTGRAEVTRQLAELAEKDLQRAELFSAPLTFAALIIVFGSIAAALLPLGVGIIAVLGTFVVLTILTGFTDVSVFALNLTTALGLGLAIDYSLFVVSRYREELQSGVSTPVAVGRSMQTAGRTVAFSAGTVAISLSCLAVFPVPYLRSFAYAGVAVVFLAAFASIIVLPALLAVLGPRVEKGRVFKVKPVSDGGFWKSQANRVMKHPIVYAVSVSLFLILLAIPFLHVNVGLSDDRVGPENMTSRKATEQIRADFASREGDALSVYVPNVSAEDSRDELDAFARRLIALDGVERVDTALGSYIYIDGKLLAGVKNSQTGRFDPAPGKTGTYLSVVPNVEPLSDAGEKLAKEIRATTAPFEFLVTGPSARLVDTKAAIYDRLPIALGLIALATFILLFMMTGSLLVPLKALLLNMLSLTATFGAMVWIFQEGHFSSWLHFTSTGTIDVFTPILMFCIAFGLSMDYEVFLLSRIKEEYDLEHDNEHAVAVGLQKTGRIVTAAALLLTIVFLGIATSQVVLVKAFGVGLTLAVLVDAFLIRATLVPAFMRLAGRLNWWSPRWLRRWHLRYGIWENEPIALLDREFETRVT